MHILLPRNVCILIHNCFSFSKGKVEEDRFIRAQDAAKLEAIHAKRLKEAQAAAAASEEDQYNTHIVPVMTEIKGFLSATDKVSDKTLEAIARWKLGL